MRSLRGHWFYSDPDLPTPITETHEFLKIGLENIANSIRAGNKTQVTFISSKKKENVEEDVKLAKFQREKFKMLRMSSYQRDYTIPYPPKCPPMVPLDDNVDFVFNRRPVNDFYMLPSAPGKFMDDHLARPSDARQRINLYRQMRNRSYFAKSDEDA